MSVVHSFLLLSNILLYGYTTICLSVICVQFGAIMNIMKKAALNIIVQGFVWIYVFIYLG